MDPKDFLIIANRLRAKNKEMHWRTSIGRSYYAVFNYLRDECCKLGFNVPSNAEAHGDIRDMFFNSKVEIAEDIGSKIENLLSQRLIADYRMNETVQSGEATVSYERARKIINDFGNIDKAALKSGIAAYKEALYNARQNSLPGSV